MINFVQNWWHAYQLQAALKQNKSRQAQKILLQLEKATDSLPLVAQLYREQIKLQEEILFQRQEILNLSEKLKNSQIFLERNSSFIQFIIEHFKLVEKNSSILQCQGLEKTVFQNLELSLTAFLEEEFDKIVKSSLSKFETELNLACQDIKKLKQGIDPSYDCYLSPHIYLLHYFLDNVYCNYLAWFLIYQSGLLSDQINILDIAAGPGTVIYGLALLLQSYQKFASLPPLHISYYSLEQQSSLQYRGLQFWRKYIETPENAINAYFRLDTVDLFDETSYLEKLPKQFFNFIFISHCFFYESQSRRQAHQIYQQIYQQNLSANGFVVLIIQGRKLFRLYNTKISEDKEQEQNVVHQFLDEQGLSLEWYRLLSSSGIRVPLGKNYRKFAAEFLPEQIYLSTLKQKYLKESWISHYTLDDYVILAKPKF